MAEDAPRTRRRSPPRSPGKRPAETRASEPQPREPQPRELRRVAQYRIQEVSKRTGVPQATLRAWERRYGFPTPSRSESGYRLYGALEVEQVRTMRRLCDEGVAASEAAKEARAVTDAAASPPRPARRSATAATSASASGEIARRLVAAVKAYDQSKLDLELHRLLLAGPSVEAIETEIVPAMRHIGELWHQGELSVAQEHLASQHVGVFLHNVLRLGRPATTKRRVLLACLAEEDHELGLLTVGTWMLAWGLEPVVLGARVPPDGLKAAIAKLAPQLVALSLARALEARAGAALIAQYGRACGPTPWMLGGLGAPSVKEAVEAHGGHVAPGSRQELERFVKRILGAERARRARSSR